MDSPTRRSTRPLQADKELENLAPNENHGKGRKRPQVVPLEYETPSPSIGDGNKKFKAELHTTPLITKFVDWFSSSRYTTPTKSAEVGSPAARSAPTTKEECARVIWHFWRRKKTSGLQERMDWSSSSTLSNYATTPTAAGTKSYEVKRSSFLPNRTPRSAPATKEEGALVIWRFWRKKKTCSNGLEKRMDSTSSSPASHATPTAADVNRSSQIAPYSSPRSAPITNEEVEGALVILRFWRRRKTIKEKMHYTMKMTKQ